MHTNLLCSVPARVPKIESDCFVCNIWRIILYIYKTIHIFFCFFLFLHAAGSFVDYWNGCRHMAIAGG